MSLPVSVVSTQNVLFDSEDLRTDRLHSNINMAGVTGIGEEHPRFYFQNPAGRKSFRFKGEKGFAPRIQGYGSQFRPWWSLRGKYGNSLQCHSLSTQFTVARDSGRPLERAELWARGKYPSITTGYGTQGEPCHITFSPAGGCSTEDQQNAGVPARGAQEPIFAADGQSQVHQGAGVSAGSQHHGAARSTWVLHPTYSEDQRLPGILGRSRIWTRSNLCHQREGGGKVRLPSATPVVQKVNPEIPRGNFCCTKKL